MQSMRRLAVLVSGLAVALGGTGCPRRDQPEPVAAEEWRDNPGLLPKPAGRVLGERTTIEEDARLAEFSQGAAAPSLGTGSAEEEFIAAADAGQAWAQTRLGMIYARTPDDMILWDKAIRLFELAAAQGDAEALYELSGMAAAGRGMPASDVTAFDYMKRAAEAGMAEAQYRLASMFSEGRGTAPDAAAAIAWGRRAAEQGHTRAQFTLGCLLIGLPDAATKQEALKWLDAATGAGNRQASLFLATALARGEYDLPKDETRSEQLLRPLAEQDDPEAQFVIAWLYMFGEKFATRREEARGWLEKAAANGHPQAAGALASLPSPDQPKMRVEPTQPRS
jgi:TPR repeat protein